VELRLETLVVPTDLSDVGDAAIDVAFRLAADHGARVVLLHVVESGPTPNPLYAHYFPTPGPEDVERASKAVEEALRERVPAVLRERVPHETHVVLGEPAEEIVRAAEERAASLVVLARSRRSALARLASRSVAERVAERAPCSVLLVR